MPSHSVLVFPSVLLLMCFGFATFGFWVWMLVDCATKEPSEGNDKLIWVLVIVFTNLIGAFIYFLVRRPERIRQFGR